MRRFRFDADVGKAITHYGSRNVVISHILRATDNTAIACMHLHTDSVIGYHPAVKSQLFMVLSGEGWVRGESPEHIPITAGQAAFWEAGESHESGSDMGMTVIVIEGDNLDPARYLSEIWDAQR